MGLRLHEGVDLNRLSNPSSLSLRNNINDLSDLGLITLTDNTLSVTPKGQPLLNGVLRQLLAD